ncbi:MAG: hypothetical protein RB191_18605 [Terriglobia bacterium]|nr:hypothetical protein [Terriglobia bacterium]
MAEKRIVVPEGMLKAAREAQSQSSIEAGLEAALRWLNGALETQRVVGVSDWRKGYNAAIDDLRRMFFVSAPEVPEAVRDLVEGMSWGTTTPHAILEAYRRGKEGR